MGEVLGSEYISTDTEGVSLDSHTFLDTQLDLEEWAYGEDGQCYSEPVKPEEQSLVCYGTVCGFRV